MTSTFSAASSNPAAGVEGVLGKSYDQLSSSSDLERTESSSSSITVHPLSEERGGNDEPKASSSSTASSPTYQSISSSSARNTNSTAASSMQTADSHSSSLHGAKKGRDGNGKQYEHYQTSNSHFTNNEGLKANGYARMDDGQTSGSASDRSAQKNDNRWDSTRYEDEEDEAFSIHDEEAPIQYPPFSEEEREARRIEQKLEKWAAEEKMRRKAKRSSRTASILGPPTASSNNRLSKRLSVLGGLGSKNQPTLPEPVPAAFQDGDSTNPYGSHEKRGSVVGSSDALVDHRGNRSSRWTREGSTPTLEDVAESGQDENMYSSSISSSRKGKARELSDPFRDPSNAPSPHRIKPSARHPIVTPGRAPTMRHLADRKRMPSEGMPAIIATDADEEKEAQATLARFQSLEDDPFQTPTEKAAEKRYTMQKSNSSYTIGSTVDTTDANKRKSTASRFNEIGLDDGEEAGGWPDEDESGQDSKDETLKDDDNAGYANRLNVRPQEQNPPPRAPWWSEWLCGCGTPTEADLEQSGRTFPE
ncbi:uncharacterized protein FA14DRAFT_156096 [Meira miltonrushii]|uniref:Uncharacterized protein n=1 Tax=Meira miltonrushii TaxID=1280837 RepID=A0A316V709_9BASI|nr:uncharacterized protein FA14DRAFT_156096 [Meira miltonrushii]PWN33399.1 hypothetical protein FA14DRAFT_156096 [Meira miltonrushii]